MKHTKLKTTALLPLGLVIACGSDTTGAKEQPKPIQPQYAQAKETIQAPDIVPQDRVTTGIVPTPEPPMVLPIEKPLPPLPEKFSELFQMGKEKLREKDTEEALRIFDEALVRQPKNIGAQVRRAQTLKEMERFADARSQLQEALVLDPKSSYAWNNLGRVELADNRGEAAIEAFEKAVEVNEHNGFAWNNLGYTYILQDRFEEAVQALERAVDLPDAKDYMWNNLGTAYEGVGEQIGAMNAFREAVALGSQKAQTSLERLEALVPANEVQVAEDEHQDEPVPVTMLDVEDLIEDSFIE